MALIPNKLQKQIVNNRCKAVHKYRRFSKGNKTYKLDVYYCANCGHQVKIVDIFGRYTICWSCEKPFSVGVRMLKLFPTCPDCTRKDGKRILNMKPDVDLTWMEDKKEETSITVDDLLREVGLK